MPTYFVCMLLRLACFTARTSFFPRKDDFSFGISCNKITSCLICLADRNVRRWNKGPFVTFLTKTFQSWIVVNWVLLSVHKVNKRGYLAKYEEDYRRPQPCVSIEIAFFFLRRIFSGHQFNCVFHDVSFRFFEHCVAFILTNNTDHDGCNVFPSRSIQLILKSKSDALENAPLTQSLKHCLRSKFVSFLDFPQKVVESTVKHKSVVIMPLADFFFLSFFKCFCVL